MTKRLFTLSIVIMALFITQSAIAAEVAPSDEQPTAFTLGVPVTTSPYIGFYSNYPDKTLIATLSDIGGDYALVSQQYQLRKRSKEFDLPKPMHALVDFSGLIDVSTYLQSTYQGDRQSDIDLNQSELDFAAQLTPWATAYVSINYDNSPHPTSTTRIANSRLFIDKAFVIAGDLARSPFFVSMGQMYVPFGDYGSFLVSDPLTIPIGKTNARTLSVGFHQQAPQALYANLYAFRGDSRRGHFEPSATSRSRNNNINQWGANLGYNAQLNNWGADVRAGYIANLADSQGMQSTPSQGFGGFGASSVYEVLAHQVPGLNLLATLRMMNKYVVRTEYVTALREFAMRDLSFNNDGAKPAAAHIEGAYLFNLFNMSSSFVLGYDHTYQALALGLPRQRYLMGLNMNPDKNVLVSFEVRHDRNYGESDVATGARQVIGGINDQGKHRTRGIIFIQYQF